MSKQGCKWVDLLRGYYSDPARGDGALVQHSNSGIGD